MHPVSKNVHCDWCILVVIATNFGFSRVRTQSGVMTAETGTYHWMAPEVIEHEPYDHKAYVFCFGIVAWELLARETHNPKHAHSKLAKLLEVCWQQNPNQRPNFSQIRDIHQQIAKEVGDEREDLCKDKPSGSFF